MINMNFIDFLGKDAKELLSSDLFNGWVFEKTIDDDLPGRYINYVSENNIISLLCDSDDKIRSIFIDSNDFGLEQVGIPFSHTRDIMIDTLGKPAKSGAALNDPILGKYGPWDRFDLSKYSIHLEYQVDSNKIKKLTLMRSDVAP